MKKQSLSLIICACGKNWHYIWLTSILMLAATIGAIAQPTINSVSPIVGIPGSTVTITGTNFNSTPANDVVYFGATRAVVSAASSTSLTVIVPAGATYDHVTVTDVATSLTASSQYSFLPTYDNSAYLPGGVNFDHYTSAFTIDTASSFFVKFADIDMDGKTDIIVAFNFRIVVYRNISTPGSLDSTKFDAGQSFPVDEADYWLTVRDLDGDGKPDIVVTNTTPISAISVLHNTSSSGTINFDPKVDIADANHPYGVVIQDINGDGKPEIIVANESGAISIFQNQSVSGSITSGSFLPGVNFAISGTPYDLVTADIDGDGKQDIAVQVNATPAKFVVFLNTGATGAISAASLSAPAYFPVSASNGRIATGDIDGDGKPDLAVLLTGSVAVFRNTSSTGSAAFAPEFDFTTGPPNTSDMQMADIDGDGKPDIAILNQGTDQIHILRNTATSGAINASSFAPRQTFATGILIYTMAIGDLDGDGKPDIVTQNALFESEFISSLYILHNDPLPDAITGDTAVCVGGTSLLNYNVSGGTWSSSNAAIATIDGTTGMVTGVAAGSATITYATGTLTTTATVTVSASVSAGAITGNTPLCYAATITLSDLVAGGVWSSTNTGIARVGSAGLVTGEGGGTTTISYTVTNGCGTVSATAIVTVNVLPVDYTITGVATLCYGGTTILSNAGSGGTWSSSAPGVATVGSTGTVTGASAGTAMISYTTTNSCGSTSATKVVTVNPSPSSFPITGNLSICSFGTTNLSDAVYGGVWQSLSTGTATVSATGVVHSLAGHFSTTTDTATISYTAACGMATAVVTVHPYPANITGPSFVCTGGTTQFSDTPAGGIWSSGYPAIGSVDASGNVTGVSPGFNFINYTTAYGCSAGVSMNILPAMSPITGSTIVCQGATITLSDVSAGSWTSGDPAIASIGTTGIVTGVASGTATISYEDGNPGCLVNRVVTVNAPTTSAGAISGNPLICSGGSDETTLTDAVAGGVWSTGSSSIVIVDGSGDVTGVAFGTATISYIVTGCGSASATFVVTVAALPDAGTITGTATVYAGFVTSLTDAVSGGTWSSFATGIATVGSTGTVDGISAGTTTISYTVNNGCSASATIVVTVNPNPDGFWGDSTVCVGSTITLSDPPSLLGGWHYWGSSDHSVAIIDTATGVVTGISAGTATIFYAGPLGFVTTKQITVNALPSAITGPSFVAIGTSVNLSDITTGGSWSCSMPSVATVGSATGTVAGLSAGTAVITYTIPSGCSTTETITVDVTPPPGGSGRTGIITTYTTSGAFYLPWGIGIDKPGDIYFFDGGYISKLSPTGILTHIAGTGTPGYSGDGGPATAAQIGGDPATGGLGFVTDIVVDKRGNIYFTDEETIRKIDASGIITTIAGSTGSYGWYSGDGGPAIDATFGQLFSIAADDHGNVYAADYDYATVRKIDTSGIINLFAGTIAGGGYVGDGPATSTSLGGLYGIALDAQGNLYIAEEQDYRLRKVDTAGMLHTIAGTGVSGNSGDGGPATAAQVTQLHYLAVDGAGNIFFADNSLYTIRMINTSGIISTVAGNDTMGYSGDGGPALLASLGYATAITADSSGNVYFVESSGSNAMRKITFVPDVVADTFSVFIDKHCSSVNFTTITKSTLPTTLNTYFGDGTSNTTALSPGTVGTEYASVDHAYTLPGTYTIKEVLLNGTTVVDSAHFSYRYLLCNSIAVQFYYDNNGNCLKDSAESYSYLPVTVEIDSNGVAVDSQTSTSGIYYNAYGNPGDVYSFRVISAPAGFVPTCSGSGIVYDTIQAITYNLITNYIGFSCSGTPGFDLAENTGFTAGRHLAHGTIIVNNNYCTPKAGTVTMNIDPKYVFVSSNPSPATVAGNTVTWNFAALSSASLPLAIAFDLSTPGGIYLTTGDTISSTYSISPTAGDADPTNNTVTRIDTVKASYDPNEMSVTPSGYILPGTTLQYAINFENAGNDTAYNVAVMDTLPDNADVTSLRIDAATAVMNTVIYKAGGHNIVKFDFPGINLPDSSHHNQCTGMVMFHIKTNSGLPEGTALLNHAGIFFDDNPVVMTDTVENIIGLIHGANSLCTGSQIVLSDLATGGTWTASNGDVTISNDTVTAVAAGIDTISYTVVTKYGTSFTTKIITINSMPAITGPGNVCLGSTIALTDATSGGNWTSSSPGIASVGSATAIVTGVATGTAAISYTLASGCFVTKAVTVNSSPSPITGIPTLCAFGGTTSLTDATAGGAWSSTTLIVGTTGIVTGMAPGTGTVTYTLPAGCKTMITVTINPNPVPITGAASLCSGSVTALTDATGGGGWNSDNIFVATISGTGSVTGMSAGTADITYALSTGCYSRTTVTVNGLPGSITGTTMVCTGSVATLSDATAGGSWSSDNTGVATVGPGTGALAGVATGTANISYTSSAGCAIATTITVNALPAAISGTVPVCEGSSTNLSDITSGGTWSSSNPAVATIGSTGIVMGISAGSTNITYTVPTGCVAMAMITINPQPATITGIASECPSGATTLSDVSSGGIWSSASAATATISSAGAVTGVSPGTTTISYTLSTGCYTIIVNTVNPLPAAISGTGSVCVGLTTTLSDASAGGTWTSSVPAVATADATGIISAVATGTANITYTLPTGCSTAFTITVNSNPGAISGTMALCAGANTDLSDPLNDGTWSSSNTDIATVATIGASTGVVIGIGAGVDTIRYIAAPGCTAYTLVTVYALPSLTVNAVPAACGGSYNIVSAGAVSYTWSPSAGLPCSTCTANTVDPAATITYTITGTSAQGCIATNTVTVNGNRIAGHIIAGGTAADSMEVWLIQFNPADSSMITEDSMLTCMDGGAPYYEFDSVAAGHYMVRAKLRGGMPGVSGYAPTYSLSSPYWDVAATIVHGSATDTQMVSMIYGTVAPGTGSISGSVVSWPGTGGTVPAAGMLVYLLNASSHVATYTYTDGTGAYSFNALGDGVYFTYPEDYKYYTTESAPIALIAGSETITGVDFEQHTTLGTITPYSNLMTPVQSVINGISVYPNPVSGQLNIKWEHLAAGVADVVITDVLGREAYRSAINIDAASGKTQIDVSKLKEGAYVVTITSAGISFNCKLMVQ